MIGQAFMRVDASILFKFLTCLISPKKSRSNVKDERNCEPKKCIMDNYIELSAPKKRVIPRYNLESEWTARSSSSLIQQSKICLLFEIDQSCLYKAMAESERFPVIKSIAFSAASPMREWDLGKFGKVKSYN